MFKNTLILLLSIRLTLSATDDLKLVYSNADIKQEEHAMATIFSLLETETNYDVIGRKLIAEMDTKFGNSWSTLITTNTSNLFALINHNTNTEITLTYRGITLTLLRSSNTTNTTTGSSTDLRAHVLNQIGRARNSSYEIKFYHNLIQSYLDSNVTNAVKIFTAFTERFESHSCLANNQSEIERQQYLNCYTAIAAEIRNSYSGNYMVIVGETTSFYTTNTFKDIWFEFRLGPLYFGVYK